MTSVHSDRYDFTVLGAGLAGMSLADALSGKGYRVLVIDQEGPGAGASGVPAALVNPATGRRAGIGWKAEQCYHSVLKQLEKVQDFGDLPLYSKSGVLRPAVDDTLYSSFRKARERENWPAGWYRWLEPESVREMNPRLVDTRGGLFIPVGLRVQLPLFLKTYADYLTNEGVTFEYGRDYNITPDGKRWAVRRPDKTIRTGSVVFACGHAVVQSPFWKYMPIHPIKGQVVVYEASEPLHWQVPVAAYGYFVPTGRYAFLAGGTYEHTFDDNQPNTTGLEAVGKKVSAVMPSLAGQSRVIRQWAGIRAGTPNRLPAAGAHPVIPNLSIISGLGSKGLLYASYTAGLLADYLTEGRPLPEETDISRFTFTV